MRKTALLAALPFAFAFLPATTSLDVLNLAPSTSSINEAMNGLATETQIASLWGNPAGLAQMGRRYSLLFSARPFSGITLLSGAVALKTGAWAFAAGASGLLFPAISGDSPSALEPGREVKAGDLTLSGSVALNLGDAVKLPFTWNLGTTLSHTVETLDQSQLRATMMGVGLLMGFRLSPRFLFGYSVAARNLLLDSSGASSLRVPSQGDLALWLTWTPIPAFSAGIKALGSWAPEDGLRTGAAMEMVFFKVLSLRGSTTFEKEPIFSVGFGVSFQFQGSSSLSLGLENLVGRPGGDTRILVAGGFGEFEQGR
jgi:hypothetical protein